jgi:hypothetical protein
VEAVGMILVVMMGGIGRAVEVVGGSFEGVA